MIEIIKDKKILKKLGKIGFKKEPTFVNLFEALPVELYSDNLMVGSEQVTFGCFGSLMIRKNTWQDSKDTYETGYMYQESGIGLRHRFSQEDEELLISLAKMLIWLAKKGYKLYDKYPFLKLKKDDINCL